MNSRISPATLLVMLVVAATIGLLVFTGRNTGEVVMIRLPHANGLEVGSDVSYRGVRIGQVRELDVSEGAVRASLSIEEPDVVITERDRFQVLNDGSGPALLIVVDGDVQAGELPAPILGTDPSRDTTAD